MKDNGIKKVFHSFRTEKDRHIAKLRRRWQRLRYRQQRIIILYLLGLFAAIDLAYIVGGFCGTDKFPIEVQHLQRIALPQTGETVEIRFYLDREGDYEKAEYEIGYIQMEGKGEVSDSEGIKLVNREVRPLAEVPGLDTENPVRQIFTLFYRSTSARRSELKFFVRDNFGREREMTVTFDLENTTAKE